MLTLQQRLRTACHGVEHVSFYNGYSGRCMYGKECVGISGSRADCMTVIGEVLRQAHNDPKMDFGQTVDILLQYDMDNMGRDMILYWPQLESIAVPVPDDTDNG